MSEQIDTRSVPAELPALPRKLARAGSGAALLPGRLGFQGLLVGAFTAMLAAFVVAAAFTWYELSLRRHDYAILHLAGQLRVTAASLTQQSRGFLRDVETGAPAPAWYSAELKRNVALYDRIIGGFVGRDLPADLIGLNEPIRCNWDAASIAHLEASAAAWHALRARIDRALAPGADEEALAAAARIIALEGDGIGKTTLTLGNAFRTMMEAKLRFVTRAQFVVAALGVALALLLAGIVQQRIVEPLRAAQTGFLRIARGDLGYQVPVRSEDELGDMTRAFNVLSLRMRRLFDLTHRIGEGVTLADTLAFVREEFGRLAPVAWVGLLAKSADGRGGWQLLHSSAEAGISTLAGSRFAVSSRYSGESGDAVALERLAGTAPDSVESALAASGLGSALIVPLRRDADGSRTLVFAARGEGAYTREFTDLLTNIGAQLRSLLDRTSLTDALVVAAVEGLARLAESRDPETGDHLVRMSHYAAILAEEMGRCGRERGRISAQDVEEIRRFAPMHDIGKVGIADGILLKPGRLTDAERGDMQRHPLIGGEVLRRCEAQMNSHGREVFQCGIDIAEGHHERWDGTGYPRGTAGEAIPLSARIVAVADVFDALTSRRPYKEAWSVERAVEAIERDAGRHFDPEVVAALRRAMPHVLGVYERLKHV
jgi:HD-GYP domain-containing protein (c-di-GMP phosphodiesterase class II)